MNQQIDNALGGYEAEPLPISNHVYPADPQHPFNKMIEDTMKADSNPAKPAPDTLLDKAKAIAATHEQYKPLVEALRMCDEAMEYMSEYDIPLCLPDKVKQALAALPEELRG